MLPVVLFVSSVFSIFPIVAHAANVTQKTPQQPYAQSKNFQQKASQNQLTSFDGIHIVKDGETLFGIARIYGISYSSLLENNSLNVDGSIRVGQKINVPKAIIGTASVQNLAKSEKAEQISITTKEFPANGQHIVAYGETIFGIARSYGVSPIDFATENEFDLSHVIKIGDKLKIPKKTEAILPQSQQVAIQTAQEKTSVVIQEKEKPTAQNISKGSDIKVAMQSCELDIIWPVSSKKIIKKYGDILKNGAKNDGTIIDSPIGKQILASYSGEIVYAGNDIAEYGNLMIIKHKDNWMTIYGYMKSFSRKVGDRVVKGDEIGKTGDTGDATAPSLYFSIRKVKTPYNPALCI
jgi:murein DD-endopeptidase MepM/ murein hydrolase activator NlpD